MASGLLQSTQNPQPSSAIQSPGDAKVATLKGDAPPTKQQQQQQQQQQQKKTDKKTHQIIYYYT